jgi:hypothetical protein
MKNQLFFTRYLYAYDEVECALLSAILNKDFDTAIFWSYELYYSGFKDELITLLFKIYFDFVALHDIGFEPDYEYNFVSISKRHDDLMVASMIDYLITRKITFDIFMLRNICEQFDFDIDYDGEPTTQTQLEETIRHWLKQKDYRSIAKWILTQDNFDDIVVLELFAKTISKKNELTKIVGEYKFLNMNMSMNMSVTDSKLILLVQVLKQILINEKRLRDCNFIRLDHSVEDVNINNYKTIDNVKGYKTLEKANLIPIDKHQIMSLFKLSRNKYNIREMYLKNWLYYASFSPIWSKRIRQFGGIVNHNDIRVDFKEEPNDDLMQEFYERYGLEPDEQTKDIQEKSIMSFNVTTNWTQLYVKFKKNGLNEDYDDELAEFDECKLEY